VCRVHDIGEADGRRFISMEYIDGEDLASLLRRIGRIPQDKAIDLARQMCAGLAAAHERGVLHRDLKPANVMVDGAGNARLTDFGLAVAADDAEAIHAGTRSTWRRNCSLLRRRTAWTRRLRRRSRATSTRSVWSCSKSSRGGARSTPKASPI
jgi:serine/threonine protein kinase